MIQSSPFAKNTAPAHADLSIDALIVGAGPAGIALAKGLHDQGHQVLLVERNTAPLPIFKGEYMQPKAVQILCMVGLGAAVESSDVNRVTELRFRDLGTDNETIVSDILMPYPSGQFAASLPHVTLLKKMRSLARQFLGEKFLEGAQITFDEKDRAQNKNHLVTIRTREGKEISVHTRWVFGTDGRNSSTRNAFHLSQIKKSGRPTLGSSPEYIVGTETHRPQPAGHRYEVIRTFQTGTVSAFRIEGNTHRIYWNGKYDATAVNPKNLWNAELRSIFQTIPIIKRLGSIQGNTIHASPANTSILEDTSVGSLVFVGDAAGVTTPFGGQGMTVALLQVEAILKTFDLMSTKSNQLKDYNNFVRDTYKRVNLLNFGLYHFFFSRVPAAKIATHHVVSHWQNHPELAERTMRLFGGLDLDQPSLREVMKIWGVSSGTLLSDTFRAIDKTPLQALPKWFST